MSAQRFHSGLRTRIWWLTVSHVTSSLPLPDATTKAPCPGLWPRASTDVMPGTSSLPYSYCFTSLAIGSNTRFTAPKFPYPDLRRLRLFAGVVPVPPLDRRHHDLGVGEIGSARFGANAVDV